MKNQTIMKIYLYFGILLLFINCKKTVEVEENEIGLVFSNWDGKVSDTLYKSGKYEISYIKGFTSIKIKPKNKIIQRNNTKDTLKLK